jgi:TctA family transporter
MEMEMLDAALTALGIMLEPARLGFLFAGVIIGLGIGVIPGLGGIVGMALLLPFTFTMDAYSAFAYLLGMGAVTTTSDTIPAVLFGVPGTVGSAATILDGHPMAKKGQAGRAFGAAYSASLIGGVFGALLLAISIPVLRPIILYLGSPELLAFSVLGLSMVAVLSGGSPLRGLAIASFGLLLAMIGSDPQTGDLRWTLDAIYLWDGLHLVPVTLGLFALPELADMAIARRSIAGDSRIDTRAGQWQGIKDTVKHRWLVLRVAAIGSGLGAIPGIGAAVIDWIAYGHAARTEKGADETFGKGDVRGVLASEGANNAKEGGALVPTIAFGVPGSASMAILLGAFLIHGLVPGPSMLSTHLDVTYSIVWSVALANILGAGVCFLLSNQFAKIATIRQPVIMPLILTVIFIGAFQGARQWGDFYTLICFGLLGWTMKRFDWPRPPLILGIVLGGIVERYLFISTMRYEWDWLTRPIVIVAFALAILGILRPFAREIRRAGGPGALIRRFSRPRFDRGVVFYLCFLVLLSAMYWEATTWANWEARIVPSIVGVFAIGVTLISMIHHISGGRGGAHAAGPSRATSHMDIKSDFDGISPGLVARRAGIFLAWLVGFLVSVSVIGVLPSVLAFVVLYMRLEGRERWTLTLPTALTITILAYILFDRMLTMVWPRTLVGDLLPGLKAVIPSL